MQDIMLSIKNLIDEILPGGEVKVCSTLPLPPADIEKRAHESCIASSQDILSLAVSRVEDP